MHSFARRFHGSTEEVPNQPTKGLILNGGWRYDLTGWWFDTVLFRGQWRAMRRQTIMLAHLSPGEQVLDVGCGTGTLALAVQQRVGTTGHVTGIDPSAAQIAYARTKAARRHLSSDFQIGVIEHLDFPDQVFDAVFSTLMMHHLPPPLKRQGLAEIARVLKPSGRLVIADFTPKKERQGQAARFHAGGSNVDDLAAFVRDAGFSRVEIMTMPPLRFSAFPGAAVVIGQKR